ncbi:hypothetical protein GQ457_02G030110 [Hibiscus cannabinus]
MFDTDKYQAEKTGWTRAVYMRKMNVADTAPINMAMPTPPASPVPEVDARVEDSAPPSPAEPSVAAEQHRTPQPSPPVIPVSSHTTTTSPATTPAVPAERNRGQTPETPLGSRPSSSPSPPALAQFDEATPPLQYMLLRSQLQRIEARQLHFQNEIKSPRDHLLTLGPVTTTPAPAALILSTAPTPTTSAAVERPTPDSPSRKRGKVTAGRTFGREMPSSPEEEEADQPLPRKGSITSSLLIVMTMTAALSNSAGEDHTTVRGRRVPANTTTINTILGLPDNDPSFYAILGAFEEEDFEQIKDYLYEEGTSWNTMGKNPYSVSRLSLRLEAKLWNTFVKRNLMPTSYNQTVDWTRLLLIHTIMTGFRVNVGEILAKELAAACANDKGILAFPSLISALCRRVAVPTSHGDKFQAEKTGWTRAVYMRKMDVADATLLNVAMPKPPASPIHTAVATTDEVGPSAPVAQAEPRHTPAASPPVVPVSSHTTTTSPATTPTARPRS